MWKALWIIVGVIPLAAAGQALPQRKPGLWEMRAASEGGPAAGMASQQCVDALTDRQMQQRAFGGADARCEQKLAERVKNGWNLESTCKAPGGTAHTRLELRGDMNRAYTVQSVTRYDPPRRHMAEARMTIQATWQGACPADLAPGQSRVLGGGPKLPPRAGASAGGAAPASAPAR